MSLRLRTVDYLRGRPAVRRFVGAIIRQVPARLRLGREFWHWFEFFEESSSWDASELTAFQEARLNELLNSIRASSPFHEERLSKAGLTGHVSIDQFRSQIPVMDRLAFRYTLEKANRAPKNASDLAVCHTSGTTGRALQFSHLRKDWFREYAALAHQWSRVGYSPATSVRAEFRGTTSDGRLVEYFPERNVVRFNIRSLQREQLSMFADVCAKEQVSHLHGYPSALHILGKAIVRGEVRFPQVEGVLLASEQIHDWQLQVIREAFAPARVYSHYGCAERTVLAGWCEQRDEYHVLPQYSLVEIEPHTKEILGTNLFNVINPFLRFRMGDIAADISEEPCPGCGRWLLPRFGRIEGRLEDYIFSVERGWIAPALLTHPLKDNLAIDEVQFVQDDARTVEVRYTIASADEKMISSEADSLRAAVAELLGGSSAVELKRVEGFERGPTGKFKWIVSSLDPSDFD